MQSDSRALQNAAKIIDKSKRMEHVTGEELFRILNRAISSGYSEYLEALLHENPQFARESAICKHLRVFALGSGKAL
jgi:hypothetical protein